MYFVLWEMREAHFPQNKIHHLRGFAARAPGERVAPPGFSPHQEKE